MKITKKLLLLIVISSLIVSAFSGCGKQIETDMGTMTAEEVKAFEEKAGGLKLPLDDRGTKIQYMVVSDLTGLNDQAAIKELRRRTGINVDVYAMPPSVYNEKGMTLIDALNALYDKHGYYHDCVDSFTFKGLDGLDKIKSLVENLRKDPPCEVGGVKVRKLEDYTAEEMISLGFPKSNVLRFLFEDNSWVAVRPSGTEPKCKFYFCVCGKDKENALQKFNTLKAVFEKDC